MAGVTTFRLWAAARAFLAVLAAACACSPAGAFDGKTLLVAGDENFPPYEFVDVLDGESVYRGFNVDLLKAVALTTGYEIRFVPLPWSDALRALERGEVDAIGGMKYDREREKIYDPKNLSYPIPSASLVSKRTNCGGPIAAMVRLR